MLRAPRPPSLLRAPRPPSLLPAPRSPSLLHAPRPPSLLPAPRPPRVRSLSGALVAALALTACSSGKSPPSPPTTPPPSPVPAAALDASPSPPASDEVAMKKPAAPTAPTCTTVAEVRAQLGKVCTVIGTYELRDIKNMKKQPWRTWPVVLLDGDKFVALESVWDESRMPAAAEIAKWRGKKVAVTGKLHAQPPSPNPANMSLLTLSPVDSITPAP